jgi:hypothetical protein
VREGRVARSLARPVATAAIVGAAAFSLASSCDTEPSAGTPEAADVMAADFTSDLSIPEQSDVVEKFYDSHPEECPNVELGAGPDDEFMNRISNAANGAEEGATMEDVLLEFCQNG